MKRTPFLTAILLLSLYLSLSGADIKTDLQRLQSNPDLRDAIIEIEIYDISSDSIIYEFNANKLFTPASNLKLFTSAAVLELLGSNFRHKTEFFHKGKIDNKGKLDGSLIIKGSGDPMISGRFRSHITEVLEFWADSLKARNITEINGGIIIDNSYFKGAELGPGWSWDDLSYWYACQTSALSFNDNCVDLKFLPGKKPGYSAIIEINPNTDYIKIHNNAVTLPVDSEFTLDYYRNPGTNDVTFFGGIAINDTSRRVDYVSVHKPEIYCATIFRDILGARDIKVRGDIKSLSSADSIPIINNVYRNAISLFDWYSDSLGAMIKVINTNSQNFFAEQLLKTLGAEKGNVGSFAGGIKAASDYFKSIGIDSTELKMYDGSGLSFMNMVTPNAIIKLLEHMAARQDFDVYFHSLATPGKDRAMRNRLKNNLSRDRVHAKTGYIANTSTFSGYVDRTKNNHLLAFSIMVNNYVCPTSMVEAWEDSVVAVLLEGN